jgi:hypothetical protein
VNAFVQVILTVNTTSSRNSFIETATVPTTRVQFALMSMSRPALAKRGPSLSV